MNLIFRTVRLENFMAPCRDNLYHHAIEITSSTIFWTHPLAKCSPTNLCLCLARSQKSKEWLTSKNSACNHTLLHRKKTKVPVTYGRNSTSDLASSNDVKGVWCLETSEICKPRFSSTSCLNVCRSNPYFVIWFCRRENFVSYLIFTQCWSLANQNKSFLSLQTSRLSFSVKRYILPYYLIR